MVASIKLREHYTSCKSVMRLTWINACLNLVSLDFLRNQRQKYEHVFVHDKAKKVNTKIQLTEHHGHVFSIISSFSLLVKQRISIISIFTQ